MSKAKEIHFTDSRGKALFSIPDGGFLRLFYGNGDDNFALCRYVDEAQGIVWRSSQGKWNGIKSAMPLPNSGG